MRRVRCPRVQLTCVAASRAVSIKTWTGPRDVYEQVQVDEQRVIHLHTLDYALASFPNSIHLLCLLCESSSQERFTEGKQFQVVNEGSFIGEGTW